MGRLSETLLPQFGGKTYVPARDAKRLTGQLQRVLELMIDGRFRTLAEIAQLVNGSEAGVSARLRDLRKRECGSYTVERRNDGGGLWSYRVCQPRSNPS